MPGCSTRSFTCLRRYRLRLLDCIARSLLVLPTLRLPTFAFEHLRCLRLAVAVAARLRVCTYICILVRSFASIIYILDIRITLHFIYLLHSLDLRLRI